MDKYTYKQAVTKVVLGATAENGGTRDFVLTVGGSVTMPFSDAKQLEEPVIAFEIMDKKPSDPAPQLEAIWGDVWHDASLWAEKCVKDYSAKAICINFISVKPEEGGTSPQKACETLRKVLSRVKVPIIVKGTGIAEIDNKLLPALAEEGRGERLLIGPVLQENYKEILSGVIEYGHTVIAESPIDINIAKQTNIMLTDLGVEASRIFMDPTTGALGYGLEYSYSIMERARLAGLGGDKALAQPFINFVGLESWRSGEGRKIGYLWEAITALSFIQAGSDLVVMQHPSAVEKVREMLKSVA